jgi:hypothetical protein
MTRSAVIQRVTYKGVLYDPAKPDDQLAFSAEAKKDMIAARTWAPGRSENYIKSIGKSAAVIPDVGGLGEAEQKLWKDYDVDINRDLAVLVDIQREIDAQIVVLERDIPRLKTHDVSAQVSGAVMEIKRLIATVPAKWGLGSGGYGIKTLEDDVKRLLKLKPWGLEAAIKQKDEELAAELAKHQAAVAAAQAAAQAAVQAAAQAAVQGGPPGAPGPAPGPPVVVKPSKQLRKAEQTLETLKKDAAAVGAMEGKALESLAGMKFIRASIEQDIRESAAEQYGRGVAGYASLRSKMNRRKFYLGEIKTTQEIKAVQGGKKSRGVLWAKPWAPGVNTAFLEGGVDVGAVYKLKTAIPDNLKASLAAGNHAAFRAAVERQGAKEYYPFWQGLENRFTTYTDELTYLARRGYRLHEFKRKNGSTQQLMVHPDQLAEVTAAYDGR